MVTHKRVPNLDIQSVLTFQEQSLPVRNIALDCLILCFWVDGGRKTAKDLSFVVNWILSNEGKKYVYNHLFKHNFVELYIYN